LDETQRPLSELGIEATTEHRRIDVDAKTAHLRTLTLPIQCA
jgi:hypothetical protein